MNRNVFGAEQRPFRHVIFDLDSTLSDSLGVVADTRTRLLSRLLRITPMGTREFLRQAFAFVLKGDIHDTEIIPKISDYPEFADWPRDEIDLIHHEFLDDIDHSTDFIDGGRAFLNQLVRRNISMVIWTNKRMPFVAHHAKTLRLVDFFERIYCKESNRSLMGGLDAALLQKLVLVPLRHKKPSPQFLRTILGDNGFDETATLFVGNNVAKDGGSTLGTGVKFVHANFGYPTVETQNRIFELSGSKVVRFSQVKGQASIPDLKDMHSISSLLELLPLFE